MTTSSTTRRRLGLLVVFGLIIVAGCLQMGSLLGQFNLNLVDTAVLLASEPLNILLLSIGLMILISVEINNLAEFHIDKFTIITLILGSLVGVAAGLTGELCSPIVGIANILIIIVLITKKPSIPRTNLHWTLMGILLGGISAICLAIVEIYVRPTWLPSQLLQNSIAGTAVGLMLKEFSTTPLEELLFRGFLWGYLRQYGWAENKIIWAQGLSFWLLHCSRIFAQPFTFFIAIPIITLIASKLTAQSKQIYPSILAHAITNMVSKLLNLATF